MAARSIPSVEQRGSYLIGAVAGATAGALALSLYAKIDFPGNFSGEATNFIIIPTDKFFSLPEQTTLLKVGAAIGAIAGVIRTAADRLWGKREDTITNTKGAIIAGFAAAPVVAFGTCMASVFPVHKGVELIAGALGCSGIATPIAIVMAPVGIVASAAARLANRYFAK